MLKLLKYEIIQSYRQYLLTFGLFLVLCILTPWLPDFMTGILLPLLMFAFMGISIAININVILNFNRSMYKRPGYLTLTLPVSTNKLIAAKFLGSLIWVLIGYMVLMIGIFILVFLVGQVTFKDILDGVNIMIKILDDNIGEFIVMLVNSFTGVCLMILSFFFTVTLTKTKYIPKYKNVLGIVIYVVGLILFLNLMSSNFVLDISKNLTIVQMNLAQVAGNVILGGIFYLLTVCLIEHKIEVE